MSGEEEPSALMRRYCEGDAAAFNALYGTLAPRLLGYLIGLVGEKATAEDLLQQTFIKVHEARSVYVRGADPVPWLYTIAHRTCLDELRRRKRAWVRVTHEGEVVAEPRADLLGHAEGERSEEGDALSAATRAALDQLPHNQREALVLTKVQGRSLREAAAITGSTPGAIKLRAHRAYVTLRAILSQRSEP